MEKYKIRTTRELLVEYNKIHVKEQILYIIRLEKRRKIMNSFADRINKMSIDEMIEEFKNLDNDDKFLNEYYFYTILHQIFIREKNRGK